MTSKKLFNKYMVLFGILAPAPIISFFSTTAYVYFLIITILIVLIYSTRGKFNYNKNFDKSYVIYSVCVMFSSIICLIRMPKEWTFDVITLSIQFVCVFLIYLWFNKSKNLDAVRSFIRGVYLSSIIQMIWGYCQLILWKLGVDLNTLIFNKMLHMYTANATHTTVSGSIKISGFCWNAGNFAPLMIIGYILAENPIIKIAFIIISLLSGSRTLMLGMLICVCLQVIYLLILKGNLRFTRNRLYVLGIFCLMGIITCALNYSSIQSKIDEALVALNFIKNYSAEGSTNTHIMYLLKTFDIIKNNDVITNLFGYGPRCSGYAFVKHYDFYSTIGKWCVECDYINILWNYGLLGFLSYYIWFFRNIIRNKVSYNKAIFFIVFLIMGFMYNITFNWVSLFLIFIFILNNNGIDIFSIKRSN